VEEEDFKKAIFFIFRSFQVSKEPRQGFWDATEPLEQSVCHFEHFEQFNNNDPLEAGPGDVARSGVNSFIKLFCLCVDVQCFMLLSMCIFT
jgi:hypothetical protein